MSLCWLFIYSDCFYIYLDPGLVHEFATRTKVWLSGDFLDALSSRPEAEEKALVGDLFNRFEAEVRAEPEQCKVDNMIVHIVMRKIILTNIKNHT